MMASISVSLDLLQSTLALSMSDLCMFPLFPTICHEQPVVSWSPATRTRAVFRAVLRVRTSTGLRK